MKRLLALFGLALLAVFPWLPLGPARLYILHVAILILIWGIVGTAWSLMGRFGLVSLGHGAFLGVGAYTTTLLWNFWGISPWLTTPLAVAAAVLLALVLGYPCFRFRVVGHYFALVTLALGEVIRLLIIAERDWTGGSLGLTLKDAGAFNPWAIQFA
ncbi:MAG: branched-chain amino acid ABC transporter permease, partial [candidate division NC10 bacterium]